MRVIDMRQKTKRTYEEYGFTLLEVLVALVIMSTAVALILQLFSANLSPFTSPAKWPRPR